MDVDPRDTLKLTESKSLLWAEAHVSLTQRTSHSRSVEEETLLAIPRRWCFMDVSWKVQESCSGKGWYSILEGFDGLMGKRNTRASQSPLYLELEGLIWEIECTRNLRQFSVTIATNCS